MGLSQCSSFFQSKLFKKINEKKKKSNDLEINYCQQSFT